MTKLLLFCCLFIIAANACFCQTDNGDFYLYKKDGSPAKDVKEASFFAHLAKLNDSTYIYRYYHAAGPMIRQASFRDSNLTIPNGRFCWYNKQGMLDSTGLVKNGRKDGGWEYKISNTQTDIVEYEDGVVTKRYTNFYDKNGKLIMDTSDTGTKDTATTDTIKHVQVQAKFGNGISDWVAYCQANLTTPERLQNVLSIGKHTVIVCFLVDKEGSTGDIFLYQSCEWSGDAEVMRLIKDSPKWKPAVQDGRTVFYRQKQSLTYNVMRE